MVSGMLIHDEQLDKLDLKKNFLKKSLKYLHNHPKRPEGRLVMLRGRAYSWFGTKNWPSYDFMSDYSGYGCLLVDEKKPLRKDSKTTLVKIKNTSENQPEALFNLSHKRKITQSIIHDIGETIIAGKSTKPEYEQLNWAITEGTSLSLLGLIKYDSENDNFVMTELGSMIGGGL